MYTDHNKKYISATYFIVTNHVGIGINSVK